MSPRKGNKFLLCAALLSALCSFGAEARKSGPEDWGRYAPDLQKNIRVYFSIPIEFSQEKAGDKTIDQRGRLLIAARHDFYYNPNTYQIDRYNYPKIQEMGFLEDGNLGYYEIADQDYGAAILDNGVEIQYYYSIEIVFHRRDGAAEHLGWFRKSWIHNGESPDSIE